MAAHVCLVGATGHRPRGCHRRGGSENVRSPVLAHAAAAKSGVSRRRRRAPRAPGAHRRSPTVNADRIVGAILGGAIGDGWGGPYEGGLPQGRAPAPDDLVVSDDT